MRGEALSPDAPARPLRADRPRDLGQLVQSRRDELTDSVMSLILHHHPLFHLVVLA